MRSLFARLYDIQKCPDCAIVLVERNGSKSNDVRICEACKTKEAEREKRVSALSLEGFIREVVNGRATVEESREHYESLYARHQEDMPYGTQKARDGDPYEWITEALFIDFEHLIEEEVV